jgi:hypothetical protein
MSVDEFVKVIDPYYKLTLIAFGLITAVFFVNDYIATKRGVANIQCQLDAKTEALKMQNEINDISKDLLDKTTQKLSNTSPKPQLEVDIQILNTKYTQASAQKTQLENKSISSDCATSGGK